ncbi:MAG: TIGR00730 family Rossman fold protein [Cytophagales bacterium]|nr:TIGR00730 family Rossman fold protein [Bernardetiaceae bacterium]MDW8210564.1 TIGR00730 family Rossman fold protein [Cytophagales bacterium]
MKNLCVYCGAQPGHHQVYSQVVAQVGNFMAQRNIRLIYGGAKVGLMGVLADAVLQAGGRVTGVIPDFLLQTEIGHNQINELIIVRSMHERKTRMFEMADAFLALPGGIGTCEALFEILTWAQLGLHHKPIGLLNVNNYFDKLLEFFDTIAKEGLCKPECRRLLLHDNNIEALYEKMLTYTPITVQKLMKDRSRT